MLSARSYRAAHTFWRHYISELIFTIGNGLDVGELDAFRMASGSLTRSEVQALPVIWPQVSCLSV